MSDLNLVPALAAYPGVLPVLRAALAAADPAQALARSVRRDDSVLVVSGRSYDLSRYARVHLLSIGKAGVALAGAMGELLGGYLSRGLVVTKNSVAPQKTYPFEIMDAGHPIPDERSLHAGQAVREFLDEIEKGDLLICTLSGGGSALITAPYSPMKLEDLQALTARLLACGAAIDEINTLRRHLDELKGGGFLRRTQADVLGLVLSDVVGSALEAIASGPTSPDPTTRDEALAILDKYDLQAGLPTATLQALANAPETLKPGDARLDNVFNTLIGSNQLALQAALKSAAAQGFNPYLLRADLAGEAREAATELCQALRWACQRGEPVARPFCMLAGGETTVTVRGDGRGGRNTELALAAVIELAGFPDVALVTLASDGEDGSTDAAGAAVTGESWRRAEALGMQPVEYLRRNDSYAFFSALDDLLKTGPTGTNVNDLVLLLGF